MLKALDFVKLDERLNDIVGSPYYVIAYIYYRLNNVSICLIIF